MPLYAFRDGEGRGKVVSEWEDAHKNYDFLRHHGLRNALKFNDNEMEKAQKFAESEPVKQLAVKKSHKSNPFVQITKVAILATAYCYVVFKLAVSAYAYMECEVGAKSFTFIPCIFCNKVKVIAAEQLNTFWTIVFAEISSLLVMSFVYFTNIIW